MGKKPDGQWFQVLPGDPLGVTRTLKDGTQMWCNEPCERGHQRCAPVDGGLCHQPTKRAPRGKPFGKEKDPRRLQERQPEQGEQQMNDSRTGDMIVRAGDLCPTCGKDHNGVLVARTGKFGAFLGCSRYPVCRFSRRSNAPVDQTGHFDGKLLQGEGEADEQGEQGEQGEGEGKQREQGEGKETQGKGKQGEGKQGKGKQNGPSAREKRGDDDVFTKRQLERIGEIADEADEALADAVSEALQSFKQQLEKDGIGAKRVEIVITKDDETHRTELDGEAHPLFERVLRKVLRGQNIMLVGPAGCGKTYLAHQLARALPAGGDNGLPGEDDGRYFASVSCTAGMTESQLTGRFIPTGERGVYLRSEFVKCFEEGGLFLLDEFDAADANVVLVLNQALANGVLPLPNRIDRPLARKHPAFVLIVAANTYGKGADRLYVGRNQMDAATLDRFAGGFVTMDYDRALETRLATEAVGKEKATEITTKWWAIRDRAASLKLRQVVSTRGLIAIAAMLATGEHPTADKAIRDVLESWPAEERVKVGVTA